MPRIVIIFKSNNHLITLTVCDSIIDSFSVSCLRADRSHTIKFKFLVLFWTLSILKFSENGHKLEV